MNQFQGLMFLQGHFNRPDDFATARDRYGARTAANDFGPALGNRAAAAAWLARAGRPPGSAPAVSAAPHHDFVLARDAAPAAKPRRKGGLLAQLRSLGGHPMPAGNAVELDVPIAVPAVDAIDTRYRAADTERRHGERRAALGNLRAQACNG